MSNYRDSGKDNPVTGSTGLNAKKKLIFHFSGEISDRALKVGEIGDVAALVESLENEAREIASDIQVYLEERLYIPVFVSISFDEGTLEWSGLIELIWDLLGVMDTIGGPAGLVYLISSTINRVIRKALRKKQLPTKLPVNTRVVIVRLPQTETKEYSRPGTFEKSILYIAFSLSIISLVMATLAFALIIARVAQF